MQSTCMRMSKIDRIKEEVGWLKVAFGVAAALDASVIAWLAQNYVTTNMVMVIGGFFAAIAIAVFIMPLNRRVYSRLEELEEL